VISNLTMSERPFLIFVRFQQGLNAGGAWGLGIGFDARASLYLPGVADLTQRKPT